jgi:geranylgeranyl diphosphate synthase type I
MHAELEKINGIISETIKSDDFIDSVKPDFLKDAVLSYPICGGKRLRPALLMWCCGMLGGDIESCRFAAASVEIYHNWTLVHDDIIDNDEMRRGKPAAHAALKSFAEKHYGLSPFSAAKFGLDFAILAGDIMQGWAVNMLLKSADLGVSSEVALALGRRLQESVNSGLISGEALDVDFQYREIEQLTAEQIEEMLALKTGVLLSFCAEAGASIALENPDFEDKRIKDLSRFARLAGIAFQLRDDWLGIFGDEKVFGKPLCSDFQECKPTLILAKSLELLPEEKKELLKAQLGKEKYLEKDISLIQGLIRCSGAEKQCLDLAEKYSSEAGQILGSFPDNEHRKLLFELLDFLLNREK